MLRPSLFLASLFCTLASQGRVWGGGLPLAKSAWNQSGQRVPVVLPLAFEANQGQADARVQFLCRGEGYSLFLTGREAVLALRGHSADAVLRLRLAGSNGQARGEGLTPLAAKSHYFLGREPEHWRANGPK
jgi:hypothetical protein